MAFWAPISLPMTSRHLFIVVIALLFVIQATTADAFTRSSRYVTLHYSRSELLHEFNDELYIGGSLRRILRKKNLVTVEDEVMAKLDTIIEKAQVVLDMFPDNMHIHVMLLADRNAVGRIYEQNYGRSARHIAYYSLKQDTIYISVEDTNLKVFSHEVGHAVVDHYFKVRPPYNIHELMAQFTSKHIQD